jgi:arginine/lysine/ornithine decarboxylase
MIRTPIHDFLVNYSRENLVRCHTPGHKGRDFPHDITEISGAGGLYESAGIISESERIASGIFGTQGTFYSCSGSTLAIQAMLALVKPQGNRIAAFRHAHRSLVSACVLLGFEVDWVYSGDCVSGVLCADTAAVFMNSLDYYGNMYDTESVAKVCKNAGIPLLVDNAHGAYLTLTGEHPVNHGAAMTADSAHKTLPALTGGAYLHVNDAKYIEKAKAMMAMFGTSSPSFLILESLDLCNQHLAEKKVKGVTEVFGYVAQVKRRLGEAGFSLRESDPLRLTVNAREYGYTGNGFAAALRKAGVECEYADENCTVLLFSTITTEADTEAVLAAFGKIKRNNPLPVVSYPSVKPERAMNARDALFAPGSELAFPDAAIGRTCAEILAPCPPGVPLIMPGERIGRDEAELLKAYGVGKIRVL